jgi:molybdopterin converting factor small subunit
MKVLLFGKIREDYSNSELNLEIDNNITFDTILNMINQHINLNLYNNLMYSLNHEYVQYDNFSDTKVNNNDIIAIIPPINAG